MEQHGGGLPKSKADIKAYAALVEKVCFLRACGDEPACMHAASSRILKYSLGASPQMQLPPVASRWHDGAR